MDFEVLGQSVVQYDAAPFSFTAEAMIGVIFFSISLCGVLGNILLILALQRNRRLHSASNLLTISLAASDLLIAAVAIPIFGFAAINRGSTVTKDYSARYNVTKQCTHPEDMRISDFLCSLNGFIIYVSSKISTWTLAGMAVERYIAVLLPLKYNRIVKSDRMLGFIVVIWLLSILLELPQAVLDWFPYVYYHNTYGCLSPSYHHMQYTHIGFTIFSISKKLILSELPLMLIGFCYYRILKVSFKSKDFEFNLKKRFHPKDNTKENKRLQRTTADELSMFNSSSVKEQHSKQTKAKRRLTSSQSLSDLLQKTQQKVTHYKKSSIWLIIIITFFMCWTPISLIGIAMNFADAYCEHHFPRGIVISLCILAIINCCVNPIVYGLLHQQVRTTFKDILLCTNTANRIRNERQHEYLGNSATRVSHITQGELLPATPSFQSQARAFPQELLQSEHSSNHTQSAQKSKDLGSDSDTNCDDSLVLSNTDLIKKTNQNKVDIVRNGDLRLSNGATLSGLATS